MTSKFSQVHHVHSCFRNLNKQVVIIIITIVLFNEQLSTQPGGYITIYKNVKCMIIVSETKQALNNNVCVDRTGSGQLRSTLSSTADQTSSGTVTSKEATVRTTGNGSGDRLQSDSNQQLMRRHINRPDIELAALSFSKPLQQLNNLHGGPTNTTPLCARFRLCFTFFRDLVIKFTTSYSFLNM